MDYKEGILNDVEVIEEKMKSEQLKNEEEREDFWDRYLDVETGIVSALYQRVVDADPSGRPEVMKEVNELKTKAEKIYEENK